MGRESRTPRSPLSFGGRGLPIIGETKPEPQAPPTGKWHYHVPVLVQRAGCAVEADAFSVGFKQQMDGPTYYAIVARYERELVAREMSADTWWARLLRRLRLRAPASLRVVPLQPVQLGFVPDTPAAPAEAPATPAEESSC